MPCSTVRGSLDVGRNCYRIDESFSPICKKNSVANITLINEWNYEGYFKSEKINIKIKREFNNLDNIEKNIVINILEKIFYNVFIVFELFPVKYISYKFVINSIFSFFISSIFQILFFFFFFIFFLLSLI